MNEIAQSIRAGHHGDAVVARMLPPALDDALLGLAERPGTVLLPVYDWKKVLSVGNDMRASWVRNSNVLWLLNYRSNADLQQRVAHGLPAWEAMSPAILGTVLWAPIGVTVAYDIRLLIETLQEELSSSTKELTEVEVESFYDANIFPARLGDNSPFYVHRRVDTTNLADEAEPR